MTTRDIAGAGPTPETPQGPPTPPAGGESPPPLVVAPLPGEMLPESPESLIPPAALGAPSPADQRMAEMNAEISRYRQAQMMMGIQQQAAQYVDQLVQAGWTKEDAQQKTAQDVRTYLLEQAVQQMQEERNQQAKQKVAEHFARQFGVPADYLMGAESPQAMARLANRMGATERELGRLRGDVTRVQRNQIVPQRYDSNRGSPRGIPVTSENIDKLYSEGRVSDDVYRRFLNTGRIG